MVLGVCGVLCIMVVDEMHINIGYWCCVVDILIVGYQPGRALSSHLERQASFLTGSRPFVYMMYCTFKIHTVLILLLNLGI